jgi:hypothetical protein
MLATFVAPVPGATPVATRAVTWKEWGPMPTEAKVKSGKGVVDPAEAAVSETYVKLAPGIESLIQTREAD